MRYRGSCHCGQVAYEVEGEIDKVLACNCSMCQRKGSLLWFVPRTQFTLLTPDANAATYKFNKHFIAHRFCPQCGIHPYAEAEHKGVPTVAINVRALEDVDPLSYPSTLFDGRSK